MTPADPPAARDDATLALTPRERMLVNAIAARTNTMVLDNLLELGLDSLVDRIVERLRPADDPSPHHGPARLVDAATLAGALGVDRSYVYAHADELGVVRLGGGSKPRLRFDLESAREAMSRYASKQSQDSNASTGAKSAAPPVRRRRRLPGRLPEPGSVLAVRPRTGA